MLIQLFYTYSRLSLITLQLRHFAKQHDLDGKHCHTFLVLLRRIRCFEACHDSAWLLFHWFFAYFTIAILVRCTLASASMNTRGHLWWHCRCTSADVFRYLRCRIDFVPFSDHDYHLHDHIRYCSASLRIRTNTLFVKNVSFTK